MKKSDQMSRVKTQGTGPEILLRRALSHRGVRYRLNRKDLPGKPDVYVGRIRLAIFVNGCFWHGHDCRRGRRPGANAIFWNAKIDGNRERDARAITSLSALGISALTLWSCRSAEFENYADEIALEYMALR